MSEKANVSRVVASVLFLFTLAACGTARARFPRPSDEHFFDAMATDTANTADAAHAMLAKLGVESADIVGECGATPGINPTAHYEVYAMTTLDLDEVTRIVNADIGGNASVSHSPALKTPPDGIVCEDPKNKEIHRMDPLTTTSVGWALSHCRDRDCGKLTIIEYYKPVSGTRYLYIHILY